MPKECKKGESAKQCVSRVLTERFKNDPRNAYVYEPERCTRMCKDPEDEKCIRCLNDEASNMDKGTRKHHGTWGGPIPEWSHAKGGPWHLKQLARRAELNGIAEKPKKVRVSRKKAPAKKIPAKRASLKKSSSSGSSSSGSSSSGSSSSGSSSSSASPVKRRSVKAKPSISAVAASIIAAAKHSSFGSSSGSSSSSRKLSRRKKASRIYVPASVSPRQRPGSASPPPRVAKPNAYEGWGTPLASSEKDSGDADVLGRIQEAMDTHPKLAPELE